MSWVKTNVPQENVTVENQTETNERVASIEWRG
jgi:hypothetical protein